MENEPTHSKLEQKVKDLEKELSDYKQIEKAKREADKEELLSRRLEESVVKRIHSHFAIFGVIVSALAIIGLFGFGKYLEYTLSDSISSDVTDAAKKEIEQVSKLVSDKVDSELKQLELRLMGIGSKVEEARKRVERTDLEAEIKLKSTLKRVEYMGRLLVEDVEKRRQEIISGLRNESRKFEEARKRTEKQSKEILDRIKEELLNLEKLTAVVRAPLRKKIAILKTLPLDCSSVDADIQRYIAILVLKEMEDIELIKRENVKEEAAQVLSELFVKYGLRDEFFAEVRLRILRAVAELGLVDIASSQVLDPRSWDRGNLILLLGALLDGKAIPNLATIVKDTKEPMKFREMAIRSLSFIGANSSTIHEPRREFRILSFLKSDKEFVSVADYLNMFKAWGPRKLGDPEIESMLPRASRSFSFRSTVIRKSMTSQQVNIAVDALSSVLSDTHETVHLRIAALRALKRFRNTKVIDVVKRVLLGEWKDFGQDAIDYFVMISSQTSVSILHDFAINDKADKSLRLKCIVGLAEIGIPSSLSALREISKKDPDDVICAAASQAVNKFDERIDWHSGSGLMKVAQGWLGVTIQEITPELKEKFDLKDEKGALVIDVTPGGPAHNAGIEPRDVIVTFNGKDIEGKNKLPYIVALTPAGKNVIVTVVRKGKTKNIYVKIGKPKERKESDSESKTHP